MSTLSDSQLGGVPPQASKSSHLQDRPRQADDVFSSAHVVMPEQREVAPSKVQAQPGAHSVQAATDWSHWAVLVPVQLGSGSQPTRAAQSAAVAPLAALLAEHG